MYVVSCLGPSHVSFRRSRPKEILMFFFFRMLLRYQQHHGTYLYIIFLVTISTLGVNLGTFPVDATGLLVTAIGTVQI